MSKNSQSGTPENKSALTRRQALQTGASYAVVAAGATAFPGWLGKAVAQPTGKPIVVGLESEHDGLSSIMSRADHVGRLLERGLLDYDRKNATFDIVPGTAAGMPEILDDGLRYRFKLREDVYFHNGDQLNADSIKYWVDMQIDPDHPQHELYSWRTKGRLSSIDRVEAVDEFTVDFHLKSFNAAQLDWFTDIAYQGHPVDVLKSNPDLVNNEYAPGPYKLTEQQRGVATILDSFDRFYDPEEGRAPRIALRPIPEMNARMAALEAGEIDWMDGLTAEGAAYLRSVDEIEVAEAKTLYVWFISLDMRQQPLDDVRVRQALNYALDKDSLIRDVLGGAAERSYSPLSKQFGEFYAGDQVTHYDYDPDKARALLEEAGYGDGFKSTIYTNTGRVGQMKPIEMSQFVQANWKEVGVDCEIEAMEWSAYETRRRAGEFPIATRGWTPSTADPDGLLYQNFHSAMRPPVQRNVAFLADDDVDRWLDAGRATVDRAERVDAFVQAQKRIVDLAPWVFVCHEITFEAYNAALQNYKPHPSGRGRSLTYAFKE